MANKYGVRKQGFQDLLELGPGPGRRLVAVLVIGIVLVLMTVADSNIGWIFLFYVPFIYGFIFALLSDWFGARSTGAVVYKALFPIFMFFLIGTICTVGVFFFIPLAVDLIILCPTVSLGVWLAKIGQPKSKYQ